MGYSCTTAALRTLQAIKDTCGADLDASNEVRLNKGRLAFFERGEEQADGAIIGTLHDLQGARIGVFRINPDGSIHEFPGLRKHQRSKVDWIVKQADYRPTVAVI